ncbi:MAG: tetratricopeptide repeat protein, partial [Isosphaeraceae bacterium]
PAIDPALEAIALKAMARGPEGRYASCRALADDVDRWLADERVSAYEEPWIRGIQRRLNKHRTAVAGVAAGGLMLMAALATVALVLYAAKHRLDRKNEDLGEANGRLAQSSSELQTQRAQAERREGRAIDAVKGIADAIAAEPLLRGGPELEELRRRLLRGPLGFFRDLRDALRADRDVSPDSMDRLASAAFERASLAAEVGDDRDAIDGYRECLALAGEYADAYPEVAEYRHKLARLRLNLGRVLGNTGDTGGARREFEKALAIGQKLADDHPTFGDYRGTLGAAETSLTNIDLGEKRFAEARDRLRGAIARQRKALATNPRNPADLQLLDGLYRQLRTAARGLGDAALAAEAERGLAELAAIDP